MKKFLLASLVMLAACTKEIETPDNNIETPATTNKSAVSCSFGINQFSKVKRPEGSALAKGKPLPAGDLSNTYDAVILLDFDGHLVSNTSWNTSGDFYCAPANMSIEEITKILQRVTEDYSPFNIAVTTDENIYNAANPYKRTRVVITETWEWYGQTGGTSFRGSFTWGDNTPCFVFNSLLGYNEKKIGEAASHEAGHTIGLRHQSSYDGGCAITSEYNYGNGIGEIGWAPIMGCSYSQNITTWHNGPNPYGCASLQNDVDVINSVVGMKTDDYSNSIKSPFAINGTTEGVMNNSSDVDAFSISSAAPVTLTAKAADAVSTNLDLKLNIYDRLGNLMQTVADPSTINATVNLPAGKYLISVETDENQYAKRYGMMGKYMLEIK